MTEYRSGPAARIGAALAGVALAGVALGAVGAPAHAQDLAGDLVRQSIRADLAGGRFARVAETLRNQGLTGDRAFTAELGRALAWMPTMEEQLTRIERPFLAEWNGNLVIGAANGETVEIEAFRMRRQIVSKDGSRALLVGDQKAVAIDTATGRILAWSDTPLSDWEGVAFESADGALVLLGFYIGPRNSTAAFHAIILDAEGRHLRAVRIGGLDLRQTYVTDQCRTLGFDPPVEIDFRTTNAVSLALGGAVGPITADLAEVDAFEREDDSHSQLSIRLDQAGCRRPAEDTLVAPFSGFVGAPRQLVPENVTAEAGEWQAIDRPAFYQSYAAAAERPAYSMTAVDVSPPRPRAAPWLSTEFDTVLGQTLALSIEQTNSGVILDVCREPGATSGCMGDAIIGEQLLPYERYLVRSPSGRFLVWSFGWSIMDLQSWSDQDLRSVSLPQSAASMDFLPESEDLYFANQNGLQRMRFSEATGLWEASRPIRQPAALGTQAAGSPPVVALRAAPEDRLALAFADGRLLSVDPADGHEYWSTYVQGIGGITNLQVSVGRAFLAVEGWAGIRVVDAATGLAVSPILVPPPALRREVRRTDDCLSGYDQDADHRLLVDAEGSVLTGCGGVDGWMRWTPPAPVEATATLARLACLDERLASIADVLLCEGSRLRVGRLPIDLRP